NRGRAMFECPEVRRRFRFLSWKQAVFPQNSKLTTSEAERWALPVWAAPFGRTRANGYSLDMTRSRLDPDRPLRKDDAITVNDAARLLGCDHRRIGAPSRRASDCQEGFRRLRQHAVRHGSSQPGCASAFPTPCAAESNTTTAPSLSATPWPRFPGRHIRAS